MAIGSGGGHWVQLLRMRRAFDRHDTAYVSTFDNYRSLVGGARYYTVRDATRFNPGALLFVLFGAIGIVARERPQVIVTTGSAPGLVFLLLGRLVGARTLWIDSIANTERLSSSGRIALRIAHRTVSQWPEVAAREGVECWGAVL